MHSWKNYKSEYCILSVQYFNILLTLLILQNSSFGQTTLIPDTDFESALIDLGLDTVPVNGSVPTANILIQLLI